MKLIKILVLLMTLSSSTLLAVPSLNGPTGLITMPTAESLHYKEVNLSYDYYINMTESDIHTWRYSLNLGTFENLEIGIVGGEEPEEGVFLNVKYFISQGSERLPLTFAAGFENLTSNDQSDFYLVVSKSLAPDLSIHGGFKAIFDETLDPNVMAGIDYMYNDKLNFLGDINGQEQTYTINVGAYFKLTNTLTTRLTIQDLFESNENSRYISYGIIANKFL